MFPQTTDLVSIINTLGVGQHMWYRAIPLQTNGHELVRTGPDEFADHQIGDGPFGAMFDWYEFSISQTAAMNNHTLFEYDIEINPVVCISPAVAMGSFNQSPKEKEEIKKIDKLKEDRQKYCLHEWVDYQGFKDNFTYCKKCDKKKTD